MGSSRGLGKRELTLLEGVLRIRRNADTMVPIRASSLKILIVDDEPELVRALSLRLNSAGYETQSAVDGLAATEMAFSYRPDLVLLDIGLPFKDGYQVAKILRSSPDTAQIPIVFLTARTWDLDKARQIHPDGYVVKPYQPAELLDIVARLIAVAARQNNTTFLES
jgi:DNA-binding response OmpR family regulator